ncbi:MAG: phosphoribosylpyrophosphate synthetase [Gammaproteobacteria bacterium SG8_11]|nr:MAG: phosphoribosylpyrophosphate synthetase [Gammaproteobacteria bacterium SG8_11]
MQKKPQMLLGFADYDTPAKNLAAALNIDYEIVDIHRFPDGESKLTLAQNLPNSIAFCRSLNQPNDKLIELMLAAQTARDHGACDITLIAPYLCYMRQDKAFNPGEAISQKIVGKFLAEHFDAVITVDAHLHRVHDLREAVPVTQAVNLSAAELIGEHVKANIENPLLLGPDEESKQWVETAAKTGEFEYAVALKQRMGDRSVKISLPDIPFANRNVVIIDDMASTGQTIIETARQLIQHKVANVYCAVTHALFYEQVTERMQQSGITAVWSTDSVQHPTNNISLARLLATAFAA